MSMNRANLVLAYLRAVIRIFRDQLRAALNSLAERRKALTNLRAFGGGVAFGEQQTLEARKILEKMSAERDQSLPGPARLRKIQSGLLLAKPIYPTNTLAKANIDISRESPQATVEAAWQQLESIIREIYRRLNLPTLNQGEGIVEIARKVCYELSRYGVLGNNPADVVGVIVPLSNRRNTVVGMHVTKPEAYDYASSAFQLSKIISDAFNRIFSDRPSVKRLPPD
jgi:hypothetical protein